MPKIPKAHRFNEDHLGFGATRADAVKVIGYLNECGYPSEYGKAEKGEDFLYGIPDDILMKSLEHALLPEE